MKYLNTLGMLAVAATALMALASSSSAGTFSIEKNGPAWTPLIHATSGEVTTHGPATITCGLSNFAATVTQHGADPVTGKGTVEILTFSSCGTNHKTVVEMGTLEFHTHPANISGGTYATVTSTGLTTTVNVTTLGIACGFRTNNTEIGTLTTSTHQQVTHALATEKGEASIAQTATIHVDSVGIPRHSGSIFCGSSSEWTGTYTITTPDYLDYN